MKEPAGSVRSLYASALLRAVGHLLQIGQEALTIPEDILSAVIDHAEASCQQEAASHACCWST